MKRILSLFLLLILSNTTAFADSATFHISEADQDDTYAGWGTYGENGFDNVNGWQFFGYSPYTSSHYDAYWKWPITIPKGAVVDHAFVRIRSDYTNFGILNADFRALATDGKWEAGDGFHRTNYSGGTALNNIPRQGPSVAWNNIPDWMQGTWYTGPDIGGLVQARIENTDYDPYDSGRNLFGLVLYYVSGVGFRTGTQQPDDDSFVADLFVEWTPVTDVEPVFESATFHIADSDVEDTFGSVGRSDVNGFNDTNGWQYFGYSSYTACYYDAYWRWPLTIPRGSTIAEAYVRIRSDYNNSGTFSADFRALVPDGKWEAGSGFGTANYPNGTALKNIPLEGAAVAWTNIPSWAAGVWYQGPDISDLVQARIDNPDYDPDDVANRHLGLVLSYVSGVGFRTGTQEPDDSTLTADLYVKWNPPEGSGCNDPNAIEVCDDGIDNNCNGEIDEFCNTCPVAVVGPDQTVYPGEIVQLDGSGSTDADGDPLSYLWSFLGKPQGSAAQLSDPMAVMPVFMVDLPGDYVFQLVVNDGEYDSEPDTCVVSAQVIEYLCPKGQGFWKKHRNAWPVDHLELGMETYHRDELLGILRMPVRGDASRILSRQLIAAKLNIAYGADPGPISDTVASADELLSGFPERLPLNVKPSTPAGKLMISLAKILDKYNNGALTPDCEF